MNGNVYLELIRRGNALVTSSVVTRLRLFKQINGFSEEKALIAAEDFDAWLRLSKLTDNFTQIEEPLGFYWWGSGNSDTPERVIKKFEFFVQRYAEDLEKICANEYPAWLAYILCRAYYRLRNYDKAKHFVRKVFLGSPTPIIFMKTVITYISIALFSNWSGKVFTD